MSNNKKEFLKWLIPIILIILVVLMFHSTIIKVIMRYGIMLLSFSGVACIFYAFAGVFTKKRLLKWILTICFFVLCVFIHIETHKSYSTVYMKEDVLYILPKSDTTKDE